uniref:Uncharacterized protein n=1 Tax=viral metagenome TaxID=1070528 RepID=A0A6C0B2M1_9ZZZZ
MLFSLEEPAVRLYQFTNSQFGGRTRRQRTAPKNKTGTKGRGAFLRGWAKQQPSTHERTLMLKRCGTRCFLGPNKSFPICTRKTCKINRKGLYAAYVRSRQWKHGNVSAKATRLLGRKN